MEHSREMKSVFERYLTIWVGLCIIGGILLGKAAPGFSAMLDGMSISVGGAPVVSRIQGSGCFRNNSGGCFTAKFNIREIFFDTIRT